MMKNLNMMPLANIDHLVKPEEFDEITLSSPALSLFLDFKQYRPGVIDGDTPAIQAQFLLRKSHERLKLVVDTGDELAGVISLDDLEEQKLMLLQRRGHAREHILVKHLMQPRAEIMALDYRDLRSSTVGDLVCTLQRKRQRHCLVLDQDRHHIRGIFSADDIARRLHTPLSIRPQPTFVELFQAIKP